MRFKERSLRRRPRFRSPRSPTRRQRPPRRPSSSPRSRRSSAFRPTAGWGQRRGPRWRSSSDAGGTVAVLGRAHRRAEGDARRAHGRDQV